MIIFVGRVLLFVAVVYLLASVVGLFRQAWSYDKSDNIEVGHYEKFGEVWISSHVSKRGGKVVYRNSTVGEVVRSEGEGGAYAFSD